MRVSMWSRAWAVSDVTTTCKQEVAFDNCHREWAHRGTGKENTEVGGLSNGLCTAQRGGG